MLTDLNLQNLVAVRDQVVSSLRCLMLYCQDEPGFRKTLEHLITEALYDQNGSRMCAESSTDPLGSQFHH